VTTPAGWYTDPNDSSVARWWTGQDWSQQTHSIGAALVPAQAAAEPHNTVVEVRWKGGWPGLFTGENQEKALLRTITQVNASGREVAAIVVDRWSFFRRLGWAFVAGLTLGFVVRHQNLLLVTAPRG
jgi:hypothetical protein